MQIFSFIKSIPATKWVLCFCFTLVYQTLFSQVPQKFSYQAIIRDHTNNPIANTQVGLRVSILQGSVGGPAIFVETHEPTSNAHGLISIEIGEGTAISGSISSIAWESGPYFVKTEADPSGGNNYSIFGTTQLMSVPYALHAGVADSLRGGVIEFDPIFSGSTAFGITALDTAYWNSKVDSLIESDPIFAQSIAAGITANDTAYWNSKLDSIIELDPIFAVSLAAFITSADTAYWNQKVDSLIENDPIFSNSISFGINAQDTAYWNSKIDSIVEFDPIFATSIAFGITAIDTAYWNSKVDSIIENDPLFLASVAFGITAADTAYWNSKLDTFIEIQTLGDVMLLGNSAGGMRIQNLGVPLDSMDAVTKQYIDQRIIEDGTNVGQMLVWNGQNWIPLHPNQAGEMLKMGEDSLPYWHNVSIPTLSTSSFTPDVYKSIGGGIITHDGNAFIIARGVCWSTQPHPTTNDFTASEGAGKGFFPCILNDLQPSTTYYARSYAVNIAGTGYGNEVSFTTLAGAGPGQNVGLPQVAPTQVTALSGSNEATATCNVINNGGANISARGFVWSLQSQPTVMDNFNVVGSGTGLFTGNISGLIADTTYYIRGYATNGLGTGYGAETTLFISGNGKPSLATNPIQTRTDSTGTSGGMVLSDGGNPITARGLCWSLQPNPSISDDTVISGSGIGNFSATMTNLNAGQYYYFRAFATNSQGTAYGNQQSFQVAIGSPVPGSTTPTVVTLKAQFISGGLAIAKGEITDNGGAPIGARGICWGTSPNPTPNDNFINTGPQNNPFSAVIQNLQPNTTYYVRAMANNVNGIGFGQEISFSTTNTTTVIDADSNIYETVLIGNQLWMSENLRARKFSNGDPITQVTGGGGWTGLTQAAWTYPDNLLANESTYGLLYNGFAANDPRNVCPQGWRVPTANDWYMLLTHLDPLAVLQPIQGNVQSSIAGGKLKVAGTNLWNSPNAGADNQSGFSALGAGYRSSMAHFVGRNSTGRFWGNGVISPFQSYALELSSNNFGVNRLDSEWGMGYSIRCVCDTLGGPGLTPPVGLSIGDAFGGGVVAYIFQPGDSGYVANEIHGIIATTQDIGNSTEWGCQGNVIGTQPHLGSGESNTMAIFNSCAQNNIAATVCLNLVSGGYSDWHLPDIATLDLLYQSRQLIGGFSNDSYWSSSESAAAPWDNAWSQNFQTGQQDQNTPKENIQLKIRAVKYF